MARLVLPWSSGSVLLGGSRSLAASPHVGPVVSALLAAGCELRVGCAAGADALVVSAALAAGAGPRLAVFAVGSSAGSGFWSGSALPVVRAAAAAGARVAWLAGGFLSVPLRARLLRRSLAALAGCRLAVFFLAGPVSPGSLRVAAAAVAAGVPAVAFCSVQPAPLAGPAGCWVPASLAGLECWVWLSASVALQPSLF
jgi:hypothetical protein